MARKPLRDSDMSEPSGFRRKQQSTDSTYRRVILLFLTVSFISLMILFSFTSILVGLKDELGLSNTQFGLLLSAFSIAYAAAQMPAGILSDRYGGKRVSLIGLFLMAFAALAFSFSTDFEVALLLRCLAGFGGGMILPAAVRLLSDWYPPKDRNIAMGIFGLGQGLGFVVTYVIGSIVVEFLGWRTGSLFSGTIVSLVVVLALIFLKENAAATIPEKQPGSYMAERKFKLPFFLFIAINFTSLSVVSGILQFTPQFLTVRFGFSTIASGFVTSLMGLTSMLSSFAGGLTSRKIGRDNVILASMLMCVALPALLGYSYYPASVLAFVALLGFGTLFYFGPLFAGVSSMGEKHRGAVFGVFNTTSFGASALSPLILGYVLDITHRYEAAFTSLSVIALIGFGAAVALKRTKFFAED